MFLGHKTFEIPIRGLNIYHKHALVVGLGGNMSVGAFTIQVRLGFSIVIILVEGRFVSRSSVNFVSTIVFAYFRRIVVWIGHGNNRISLDQNRKFPDRRVETIDYASTAIGVAIVIIHPFSLGQVYVVANVVSVLVHVCFLVNWSNKKVFAIHKLVLRCRTKGEFVGIVEKHCAYDRFAIYRLVSHTIGIRQKHTLKFKIGTVDSCSRFAKHLRIFGIASPAVHIEFHRSERFPLKFANVYGQILPAKNSVDIRCDIRLTGKSRTYKSGNMKANVFPISASLVSAPNSGVTLCACPTVKRDYKRAGIRSIIRHNASHIAHTVKAEAVTPAHPCYVGFQHPHSRIAYFFHDITLQQWLDSFFRVQVALGPQAYLNSLGTGVIAKFLEIVYISVKRICLTIACAITVVGKKPPKRHVIVNIPVNGCTG